MGLEELVARLERDADARVTELEERARREVEALEAEGALAASRQVAEVLATERAKRGARLERERSEARLRARATALAARRAILDRVMARAAALLEDAPRDATYVASLPARIELALTFVPASGAPSGASATLRCRPELAPAVRKAVGERAGVDVDIVEVASMPMGVVITSRDGSMEVDDTMPARLERARDVIAIELLPELST